MQIDDISLSDRIVDGRGPGRRNGLTGKLFEMNVGQSVFVETTYVSAHVCITNAKRRVKNPLIGSFKVVQEGSGVRVGRVA